MTTPAFDRWITPWALFAGAAVAFVGCCATGYVAGRHNHIHKFERLHYLQSIESKYYPTACEMRELARSRLDRDKIAVIVAGNSVLNGIFQGKDHIWTKELQMLLGERYQVLNLAALGAYPGEFGAITAESLSREYKKLIVVTITHPGLAQPEPDGCVYKFFFWDALYKGLLLPHPSRDRRLREELEEMQSAKDQELRRQMACDGWCRFGDLWNTIAHCCFATMWTPQVADDFTRPRGDYEDDDVERPAGYGNRPEHYADHLAGLRGQFAGRCVCDSVGNWTEDDTFGMWAAFDKNMDVCFPDAVRPHTLMLVYWLSPLYLQKLSPTERACHAAVSRLTVQHIKSLGLDAAEINRHFTVADYVDHVHLTRGGGGKLAAAVAVQVQDLARRLGYDAGEGTAP